MNSSREKPTQAAIYERALRIANRAAWTVDLQINRLKRDEPEDHNFIARKTADFHFLIITLDKLRKAAKLASTVTSIKNDLDEAIKRFDKKLPALKTMRNVEQHFDQYANDEGHSKSISRLQLEVWSSNDEGWCWLNHMKLSSKQFWRRAIFSLK